ncbi:ABC transporter permease [Candidatus Aerophobetes bacterium]|uniref:ABC transporter permease n=1 Tax=Aerophobetes bacterium TaxID=2030807 RepID=A0A2A4YFY0_UNCAE|nr:MAG: ABC transporter permease [Candidatus Aerophobetes bacterium]
MSPYSGCDFFSFFGVFFPRMWQLLFGKIGFSELASDEIQVIVLICSGISAALVGCFLVLKKMTMLANALSHTVLLGIVTSFLVLSCFSQHKVFGMSLSVLLLGSILAAFLTTTLVELCKKLFSLDEGSSIGLIFSFLFAIGIALVTVFAKGVHLGTEAIMGNIDALHVHDIKLVMYTLLASVFVITVFFKYFQILCFDGSFAKSIGLHPGFFHYLLMLLTASASICCFRAIGVFLFLIFLTAPAMSARLFTKKLRSLLILSCVFSIFGSLLSIAVSRHVFTYYDIPLSTAGLSCVILSIMYPVALLVVKMQRNLLKSKVKYKSDSSSKFKKKTSLVDTTG